MMDLKEGGMRVIPSALACRLAGADPKMTAGYLNRGVLETGERFGQRQRLFNQLEVLHLAVFSRLAAMATPEKAKDWAEKGVRKFLDLCPKIGASQREFSEYGLFIFATSSMNFSPRVSVEGVKPIGEGLADWRRTEVPQSIIFVPIGAIWDAIRIGAAGATGEDMVAREGYGTKSGKE